MLPGDEITEQMECGWGQWRRKGLHLHHWLDITTFLLQHLINNGHMQSIVNMIITEIHFLEWWDIIFKQNPIKTNSKVRENSTILRFFFFLVSERFFFQYKKSTAALSN